MNYSKIKSEGNILNICFKAYRNKIIISLNLIQSNIQFVLKIKGLIRETNSNLLVIIFKNEHF